ncbi:hypothetical protein, partial [Virgibacillus sp. 7505]|uniref:hypothetical protein n=1 Tax=Virgibacillus sp. 7505 TaxID=2022548 RepID=UPI0011402A45
KTMPNLTIVERDYTQIYNKYISLGPALANGKVGAHGVSFPVAEEYEELKRINGIYEDDTIKQGLPKLYTASHAAEII